ncbi:hypothetical protein NB464_21525 [Vibrio diabolicus]|uniref:hypothetical protein n=1 Tax=Vibrio harveyi group TaxID=717610 RepID=UPI00215CCAAF|nr:MULTISPECIES: hypothetical protein [Vibrio harveyi group]MCR9305475.1 hypothetical protein [Vibrio diabolicus]MCR9428169.1 hypothetical protein [Vibrio diabolicus]MCS0224229.1 hypothetical protein [Vibrio alginolyticus]MCS0320684.1 hypothetical protein [Vibrio diabolicus]MCS0452476.1 hypothetical protein [Vibrio diabolicus]
MVIELPVIDNSSKSKGHGKMWPFFMSKMPFLTNLFGMKKGRKRLTRIHATEKMNTHVIRWWLPEANRFKQYLSNGVKIGTGWRFSTSPSQCDTQPHPNPHRIAPRIVLVAFNASIGMNISPIAK